MVTVTEKLETSVSIESIYQKLSEGNYSIGVFKMPGSNTIMLIGDEFPTVLTRKEIDLEQIKGFLVSPFDDNDDYPNFVIKPSFVANYKILENGDLISEDNFDDDFIKSLGQFEEISANRKEKELSVNLKSSDFEGNVKTAVQIIESGSLKKVVLSRQKEIELSEGFNLIRYFLRLCKEYPSSFVSVIDSSISGVWIGATPEILVSLDNQNHFKTVSLAGTKQKEKDSITSKTLWSEKEIEEQALVSRYIIECFKKIRLREYEEVGPKTVCAGNLLHLKTEFTVNLNEVNYENLGTLMLGLLHPTSAVCGMPKEPALELIKKLENSKRAYYSGFLGPVNMNFIPDSNDTATSLFVNLRCMQVGMQSAILYAGAGITHDSVPESEFLETEHKFQTLLNMLQS